MRAGHEWEENKEMLFSKVRRIQEASISRKSSQLQAEDKISPPRESQSPDGPSLKHGSIPTPGTQPFESRRRSANAGSNSFTDESDPPGSSRSADQAQCSHHPRHLFLTCTGLCSGQPSCHSPTQTPDSSSPLVPHGTELQEARRPLPTLTQPVAQALLLVDTQ